MDRVRVVGQLIDTRTDEHIWSETYDKEKCQIYFELQSEVARNCASMKSELTVDEKARINEKHQQKVLCLCCIKAQEIIMKMYTYLRKMNQLFHCLKKL